MLKRRDVELWTDHVEHPNIDWPARELTFKPLPSVEAGDSR